MLLTVPLVVCVWTIIHPFIRFWRKLGPAWTYSIMVPVVIAVTVGAYWVRDSVILGDCGANTFGIAVGIVLMLLNWWMFIALKKQLPWTTMMGLPELSPKDHPQPLIFQGIYARIRHPRYAQVLLSFLSVACIVNYLSVYALFIVSVPLFYLIAWLEERELMDRYGLEYEAYKKRTAMMLPKTLRS